MAPTPEDWLKRLISLHDKATPVLTEWDQYYEGDQVLSYLAPELQRELSERMRQLLINWPRLVVDALEERLDVEGFRFAGTPRADSDLWDIWQANDLDEESSLGHIDALALARSYVIVGAGDTRGDPPLITVESALEVFADRDPRTRRVSAAVKRWTDDMGSEKVDHATLYLPDQTLWWIKKNGKWVTDPDQKPDNHNLHQVPVEPLVNRARTRNRAGVSELKDVVPVSDGVCKVGTDMMVSSEFTASQRRWAVGLGPDDFTDPEGNTVSSLSARIGSLWVTDNPEAKFGVFPEANLEGFFKGIDTLARVVSGLTGLPPHFLGYTGGEPISADAIRASEARLIKRAERRQRSFGASWERVMRLAMRIRDNQLPDDAASLETVWRDPATPTRAQQADAAVKLFQAGLLPREQAWEDLGYTEVQIARMLSMLDAEHSRALGMEFSAMLGLKPPPAAPDTPPVPAPVPEPVGAGV